MIHKDIKELEKFLTKKEKDNSRKERENYKIYLDECRSFKKRAKKLLKDIQYCLDNKIDIEDTRADIAKFGYMLAGGKVWLGIDYTDYSTLYYREFLTDGKEFIFRHGLKGSMQTDAASKEHLESYLQDFEAYEKKFYTFIKDSLNRSKGGFSER